MPDSTPYLLTSALPYANGPLHLGHLAGAYLPADLYARYLRLRGEDVVWVCGSDEHGAAITLRAKKEGISPRDIVDKYHELNKRTFQQLGISFDYYHRTSDPLHHETSRDFFSKLAAAGDQFELRTQEQYYDPEYDQFLADRYIKGTCPRCGHPEAYGDQCENCGSDLSPLELIDPVSTLSGNQPILRETTHWYFRLDRHEAWLTEWIEKGSIDGVQLHDPADWKNHVIGQCMSWLKAGLHPRAITRDLDWGISVPAENAEGKVLYVWFDAPIGYISSTRQWAEENNKDWEHYWKNPDTKLIHFIGKDNIVFHCLIFPAMLRAYGDYVLPTNVPANQFLNFEGQKFSKSRGWGIEQHDYLAEFADFPNKEDALRWALIRNLPENKDADFKWADFIDYHDKDLADKLGNFVNRVIVLTHKYFDGQVPSVPAAAAAAGPAPVIELLERVGTELSTFNNKQAAATFIELATWGNVYLQEAAPWTLAKANPDDPRIAEILWTGLQTVAALSVAAAPFLPFTAPRLRNQLNLPPLQNGDWDRTLDALRGTSGLVPAGHTVAEAELLFPKIVDRKDESRIAVVRRQQEKLEAVLAAERGPERPPVKEVITFEDFQKLDLRTGTVTAALPVKKADKLLQLTIDLGNETRTVLNGIAEHYTPEAVIGKRVVLVANLAPRKMRGIMSEGMVLMAEDADGKLTFIGTEEELGNGWVVR